MGGCAALNCSNHSRNKFHLFRFPRNEERRQKWLTNCMRSNWTPGPGAFLCEVHFEEDQFELHRRDGKIKLKWNAIPTLFSLQNKRKQKAPQRIPNKEQPKNGDAGTIFKQEQHSTELTYNNNSSPTEEVRRIFPRYDKTQQKLEMLQKKYDELNAAVHTFLSDEQIKMLHLGRKSIAVWSEEEINRARKLRFALGKSGYKYLIASGYPAPSSSTLNRRIQKSRNCFNELDPAIEANENMIKSEIEESPSTK